jgi:hypothetical protein
MNMVRFILSLSIVQAYLCNVPVQFARARGNQTHLLLIVLQSELGYHALKLDAVNWFSVLNLDCLTSIVVSLKLGREPTSAVANRAQPVICDLAYKRPNRRNAVRMS